jgi:Chitobiase/beta-hexosaminidase C-terminal domain/Fibronectin type III domain
MNSITANHAASWRPLSGLSRVRRLFTGKIAALTACLFIAGLSLMASAAYAAVPAFPDNIVVFPNRDFITVEGFQDHVGDIALVEVTRPGVGVVGSARVQIAAGDPAFEINHPGGACWGAGTGVNVTPDIVPGDIVSLDLGGTVVKSDVTTQDAYVTKVNYVDGATTFTVEGHIAAGVNPDNVEQRIVNPALTGTAVARRDIRALPGPLTADRNGQYESGIEITGTTFVATYVFLDPAVARIAATGGGERFMTWQVTDADANRQGLTIAEFGELGGPGMGGCPNGPLGSGPPGPTGVMAANVASGIKVNWTPAVALPGTPAITGYRVTAVSKTTVNDQQVEIGRRIAGQGATTTTITGLDANSEYDVYVVSVSSAGETFPAIHAIPQLDTAPPVVSSNPAEGTYGTTQNVRLTSSEPNSEIYFTLGDAPVLDESGQPSVGATLFTAPIEVTQTTTINSVAFDPTGNVSEVLTQTFTIDASGVAPGKPTITSTSVGTGSITVNWAPDASGGAATSFQVDVTDASNNPVGTPITEPTGAASTTITGLAEAPHFITVTAINGQGTATSAKAGPLTPLGLLVADAGLDQTITRGLTATTVTLNGTKSVGAATYSWQQISPVAPTEDIAALTGANADTATFSLPLFAAPATNTPRVFRLTVTGTDGATRTDDVTVNVRAGDNVTATATWKAGDFRVTGTGTVNNSRITIRLNSRAGRVLGTVTVAAGVWQLRLRDGAAPATRPTSLWIDSSMGAMLGPVTVN